MAFRYRMHRPYQEDEQAVDTYDADELYAAMADDLFASRRKANAAGGSNNIRARGEGPEQAARELIGSLIGNQYRVTQGHVVRADGLKSGQIDIIIVRNVPAATMHTTANGGTELVRVEWVAAVGEVKSSWAKHSEVVRSYCRMVKEIDVLQEGIVVENTFRFGAVHDDSTLDAMARPVTGRPFANRCYAFLMAFGQGMAKIEKLEDDFRSNSIRPSDAAALILDPDAGATLCIPGRISEKGVELGISSDVNLKAEHADRAMTWVAMQEDELLPPRISSGRLLHYLMTDLQLHLGTWYGQHISPKHYSKLGKILRHRDSREAKSN